MGTISRTCERRWSVQRHALNWSRPCGAEWGKLCETEDLEISQDQGCALGRGSWPPVFESSVKACLASHTMVELKSESLLPCFRSSGRHAASDLLRGAFGEGYGRDQDILKGLNQLHKV
jgi:hypothetical protein